jgi:hypothetical protein
MLIVPLKNDKITTIDGPEFIVDSYTNLKASPAVYVDVPIGQNNIVYFQDISQINEVKVEYNKSTNIFTAFGVVKRKYNLPQPKDEVIVKKPGLPDDSSDNRAKVKTLKLHNKSIKLSKGLVVIDTDDNVYELSEILDIEREIGSDTFKYEKFMNYYDDYLPYIQKASSKK